MAEGDFPRRVEYSRAKQTVLLPEIVMLGWSSFPRAKPDGLRPHTHEDAFEICYLTEGSVEWWVGETPYVVERGDLFVTRPGEAHGGANTMMHPCELYWVQVAVPDAECLPGLSPSETNAIRCGLRAIDDRRFAASPTTEAHFAALLDEHRAAPNALSAVAARAALHRLLVEVLRDAQRAAIPTPFSPTPHIARALVWMQAHLGEAWSVEEAARIARMSEPRFHEHFLREMKQTPADWRMRQRIAAAKTRLVERGATVSDVAFALGFGSSQYFATAFKKYTGQTPTEYRQQQKETQ